MGLWELLSRGGDGFSEVPTDRWDAEKFQDPDGSVPGRAQPMEAAFLKDVSLEEFDAQFFGFSPREAETLDPQQRMLLEVCWEAFEDAGIPPSEWEGRNVGVYIGGFTMDNLLIQTGPLNLHEANQFTATNSTLGMLSNRLSYVFNLKGPSLTIDTACSSSMVAFHYACHDLWSNRCEAVMVGGANAILNPAVPVIMSKGGFLSPTSRSKAFDVTADGYARGEGAGLVIIKPLEEAVRAGDRIYAVVRGTGVNQDGRTPGIASPNMESQEALIRSVLTDVGVSTDDLVLIEAHGTGTAIGDPTEVSALSRALGQRRNRGKRFIGSVKGNLGHQEAGAGVAGLIKAALCLYHGKTVPQANLENVDPSLILEHATIEVSRAVSSLPETEGAPLACVNSFGFGGSNAHAVLAQYRPTPQGDLPDSPFPEVPMPTLLLLSAKDDEALRERSRGIQGVLDGDSGPVELADLSHTLACHVDGLGKRRAIVADSRAEAREALAALVEDRPHPALFPAVENIRTRDPVFVFTGMGPQWWGMGHTLYSTEPVFKGALQAADAAFREHSGWSILSEMLKGESESRMISNEIAQPANFVLQHGLTALLASWGVRPGAVVGHSIGEVGAALACGCLTLEDAALVAYHRSRLQQRRAGLGNMLATGLSLATAQDLVELYPRRISIGAINGPTSTVLSGDPDALDEVAAELTGQGILNKRLFGEVAYHSHQMDGLEEDLLEALASLEPSLPTTSLYSTVSGALVEGSLHDGAYWWRNVRSPVQLQRVLERLAGEGFSSFVEIGPHPVLGPAIAQTFASLGDEASVHPSLVRRGQERGSLLRLAGSLWCEGHQQKWSAVLPGRRIPLPNYPWQRKRHWRESQASSEARRKPAENPFLGVRLQDPSPAWEATLGSSQLNLLRDHIVGGRPIFPAAAYMEAFLAAVESLHPKAGFGLSQIRFNSLLVLPDKGSLALRTDLADDLLTLNVRDLTRDDPWREYSRCRVVRQSRTRVPEPQPPAADAAVVSYTKGEVYERLLAMGLEYQGQFQTVERARVFGHRVSGVLRVPLGTSAERVADFICPPSLVDGGLQLLALAFEDTDTSPVPVSIDRLTHFKGEMGPTVSVEAERLGEHSARLLYLTEAGAPILELHGVRMKAIPRPKGLGGGLGLPHHTLEWRELEVEEERKHTGPVIQTGNDREGHRVVLASIPEERTSPSMPSTVLFMWEPEVEPSPSAAMALLDGIHGLEATHRPGRFILVTRNAWRVVPADTSSPGQSALWGLARCLKRERGNLDVVCVDVAGAEDLRQLGGLLGSLPPGSELAIRGGQLYHRELSASSADVGTLPETPIPLPEDCSVTLEPQSKGGLGGLRFRQDKRREPRGNEIEVQFGAASLNFKDVLKVLGILPEQSLRNSFFGDSLGMESAGTVIRVGPESDLRVGERIVAGFRGGGLRTFSTFGPEDAFINRWGDLPLSLAQLAPLAISFVTAQYGLLHVARLQEGETVLLHSASGGVGHAAIQVARSAGARVMATAGTVEKRGYLNSLGLIDVFDSRSLDFEDQVMAATGGGGVDVVLNFLPEALLHANLRVLADFGRLVEIGKADIAGERGLPLAEFERNLTFGALDIDQMLQSRRDLFDATSAEVKAKFDAGEYQALPVELHDADQVVTAFREFAEGNHIGKRVLALDPPPRWVLPRRSARPIIRPDSTYLVTGGSSGFGLETARWLVDQGANHLILASRTPAAEAVLLPMADILSARGGQLISLSCDVGSRESVGALLQEIEKDHPPLRGIFHAAAVLADAPAAQQTAQSFATSFHAKSLGALHLHEWSRELGLELDHFVLFASISGMVGNSGQANYAAANAYLDGLAEHRRSLGLPATSIAWGPIAETGMVARSDFLAQRFADRGLRALTLEEAFDSLAQILAGSPPSIGVFSVAWEKWGRGVGLTDLDPVFPMLKEVQSGSAARGFRERFGHSAPEDRSSLTETFLRETLGTLLNMVGSELSDGASLLEMGVDSLMAVELQLALESELGQPGVQALDLGLNLAGLTSQIVQVLERTSETDDDLLPDVESLSDAEVDHLLDELLSDPPPSEGSGLQ
jgi:acyl transferase domain-containing protein/NADPH:quinone reductase-like Zn-dependent oxidoreductase